MVTLDVIVARKGGNNQPGDGGHHRVLKIVVVVTILYALVELSHYYNLKHQNVDSFYQICLEGVVYYNRADKLAPAFTSDGKVKTCEKESNTVLG